MTDLLPQLVEDPILAKFDLGKVTNKKKKKVSHGKW